MLIRKGLLLAGLLLVGAIANAAGTPAPSTPDWRAQPWNWAVLGASTAAGTGASSLETSWVGLLQQALKPNPAATVNNLAKGGYTTFHGIAADLPVEAGKPATDPQRNIDRALALKPQVLLVAYGTNDGAKGFTAESTFRNLVSITDAAKAAGVRTLVFSTLPRTMSADKQQLLRQVDVLAKARYGACFLEIHEPIADPATDQARAELSAGDGVHVNDAGHAIIFRELTKLLDSRRCF